MASAECVEAEWHRNAAGMCQGSFTKLKWNVKASRDPLVKVTWCSGYTGLDQTKMVSENKFQLMYWFQSDLTILKNLHSCLVFDKS